MTSARLVIVSSSKENNKIKTTKKNTHRKTTKKQAKKETRKKEKDRKEKEKTIMMTSGFMTASLVTAALAIAGQWKMLEKMGEKGWKALVPFYGQYLIYKHTWSKEAFWATLAMGLVTGLGSVIAGGALVSGAGMAAVAPFALAATIASVATFTATVLGIISYYKICKSFGHGIGYTLGMFAVHPIFEMILGFGKSEFVGA